MSRRNNELKRVSCTVATKLRVALTRTLNNYMYTYIRQAYTISSKLKENVKINLPYKTLLLPISLE